MKMQEETHMKKRKIVAILLSIATMITPSVPTFASEIDDRIAEVETQILELQTELSELKAQKRENTVVQENNSSVTLYDSDLKILENGISADNGISLYIENNSSLNLGIMTYAFAINGYMVGGNSYGFNSFDVASGRKTNAIEQIETEMLDKYDISSFGTLDILFWAYDNDKSFKSFDTGQIHAELTEGAQNLLDVSGETLYDNAGIKVDYIESHGNTYTYCLTNTSGNYLDFTVENLTVNDYTSSDVDYDLFNVVVLNNCQLLFDVTPEDEFLSANGIKDVYSVEFTLDINPMSDYSGEWVTDMITKVF